MRLGRKVLVALVALVVAAPTAIASDDPAGSESGSLPGSPTCVVIDTGSCPDPGGSVSEDPNTDSNDKGDNSGDSGSTDGSGGDQGGGGSDTTGDGSGDGSGDSDPSKGDGDEPGVIDLCSWEPWNCGGGPGPGECNSERIAKRIPCYIVDPPRCNPNTPHGSKICLPYHPTDPVCKADPETGEQSCWTPPELCLTAKFASEADAAAAGCPPPSCTVAEDGTVDCANPYCPDCVVPYPPPPCDYAENAAGEVSCERPLPCFIDDEGNKVCAVYDFAPGESQGGDSGGDDGGLVGVCVIGVDSPCNGQPEPRKDKSKKGGKPKRGGKAGPKKGAPGKKRKATTPKSGGGSSSKGSTKKGGAKAGKPDAEKPKKK
ncbi:MAG: hypothetical protein NTX07_07220, partial [Solirubrobacterales bacterium]|nr:hypothetical protein [Solirubrobacterales bacterium]